MFNIKWNKEVNGIILNKRCDNVVPPPRPVFFEELDLLGFDRFWNYPKSEEPLLWAIGRRYYYKGLLVAEARGGNIFEAPKVIITEDGKNLKLEPINIGIVVKRNEKALSVLENEALDFIEHTYKVYKKKGFIFSVSFSGGKDSQVVLDLVTRVIPPDELLVVFSDTTMEISYTYENVERTKEEYERKYPGLKFLIAKPPKSAIEFWKEFGPPSRIHRWCCTVTKTAPFKKLLVDKIGNTRIVVFEGVRADESERRVSYEKVAEGVKHTNITNARIIFDWNTSEVWLYSFYRNLKINKAYRFGLTRIGCSVCPFASEWSEYILSKVANEIINPFLLVIKDYSKRTGLRKEKDILNFIKCGQWKKRAGGKSLRKSSILTFVKERNKLDINILNPKESFLEWLKVIGKVSYKITDSGTILGEVRVGEYSYSFSVQKKRRKEIISFPYLNNEIGTSYLKKIFYKTTYCVNCGSCEIECPTGALQVYPKVKVNLELCIHCYSCINFTDKGCVAAKSLCESGIGGKTMSKKGKGIDRYSTFGLREGWLASFLNNGNNWLSNTNLGPKQIPAVLNWLSDAGLLESRNRILTELGEILSKIYSKDALFVWSIIWNNFYYNSKVVEWYLNTYGWNEIFTKKELKKDIKNSFPDLGEGTLSNPIDALVNMLDKSPLGKTLYLGNVEKKGRIVKKIKKLGTNNIHPLAIAYSLYKAAEHIGRRDFTVSELYSKEFAGGPYKLFGISRESLEKILVGLQEDRDKILRVDLAADLDNIYLREDLSSLDIIKIAEERLK